MTDRRKGEPDQAPPPTGSFGDIAGEMSDQTEVEEPVTPRHDTQQTQHPGDHEVTDVDSDSVDDDLVEDGSPLEPSDADAERAQQAAEQSAAEADAGAALALAERTADLQRLQAEYLNYKRRVDRDRELVRENATYTALAPVVEVLDTIDRAKEHGELDPGLQAVADQLERAVTGSGLVKYAEAGDAFDPRLHEALSHMGEDPEVEVTTVKVVAKAGYRIGDRVIRAAQVLVVDPAGQA